MTWTLDCRETENLLWPFPTADPAMMRRSVAIPEDSGRRAMARALYPYQTSGDNQLAFIENDLIVLIGD